MVNDSNLSNNQWSFSQRSRLLHNSSNFNNGQGHTFLFIQLNQRKMNCKKRVGFFCYSYSLYSRCLWQRQMWMSLPRLLCAKMRNDVCTAMLLWTLRTSELFSKIRYLNLQCQHPNKSLILPYSWPYILRVHSAGSFIFFIFNFHDWRNLDFK